MAPTKQEKHEDKCMDLLALIGKVNRSAEARDSAQANSDFHGKEMKQHLKEAHRVAVEIRDSKFRKDKDE